MRAVFMGTPQFAIPSLEALIDSGHDVVGVWTRADRPRGRGHHPAPSPVKELAVRGGIPVFQPGSLRRPEAAAEIAILAPEIICVAAYGLILPAVVLDTPRLGCVNVHASLLPRYRGAAPIHRAVMAGETVTGITTMMMDVGLDTGDILLTESEFIGPEDTTGEVEIRLAAVGARLLMETLALLERGRCPRTPQDSSLATYARPVTREESRIDWNTPACDVHRLIRGVTPRPGAFTLRSGEVLRIHRSAILNDAGPAVPGLPFSSEASSGLAVACGSGALELLIVQPAGRKAMSGAEYLRGHPFRPGETLG